MASHCYIMDVRNWWILVTAIVCLVALSLDLFITTYVTFVQDFIIRPSKIHSTQVDCHKSQVS